MEVTVPVNVDGRELWMMEVSMSVNVNGRAWCMMEVNMSVNVDGRELYMMKVSVSVNADGRGLWMMEVSVPVNVDGRGLCMMEVSMSVNVDGRELCMMEAVVVFNVNKQLREPAFALTPTILKDSTKGFRLKVCFRWLKVGQSTMGILEVYVPSGMEADLDSIDTTNTGGQYKKVEKGFRSIILYFDTILSTQMCIEVDIRRVALVARHRPVPIKLREHNEPSNEVIKTYQSKALSSATIIEVCGPGNCVEVKERVYTTFVEKGIVYTTFVEKGIINTTFVGNGIVKTLLVENGLVYTTFVEKGIVNILFVEKEIVHTTFVENEIVYTKFLEKRIVYTILAEKGIVTPHL
ncbi:unnamed protein product [Mytilus coruscus]|uniref:Alpha-macroglobulin receptor-binding domain-containing protein n=1 Tax=Mytilus coruscus TaxID=42192 RepID=A0A6J8DGM5_MYTCO|nr:unnamed protein product [Mytilus coruscus]